MLIRFPTTKGFVFTIDLSKITGRTNPRTIEAPVSGNSTDYFVDWGDGETEYFPTGSATWPTHEYADDAGDVFTVVLRSSNGDLPRICFNTGQTYEQVTNATKAIISADHFGGTTARGTRLQYNYCFMATSNMTYCDPRWAGQSNFADLYKAFQTSGISQPLESFCLDFGLWDNVPYTFSSSFQNTNISGNVPGTLLRTASQAGNIVSMFQSCLGITGEIPAGFFDGCTSAYAFNGVFNGCKNLTGSPPRFPASARNLSSAFSGCSGLDGTIPPLPANVETITYLFYNCEKLTGLFPELPESLVQGALAYAFYCCYSLTGPLPDIPDGATSLQDTFYQCFGATAFPSHLPSSLTDVRLAFYNCRGLNVSTNAAPELWNTTNYPNITQTTYCFAHLTSLSNYADIPAGWK